MTKITQHDFKFRKVNGRWQIWYGDNMLSRKKLNTDGKTKLYQSYAFSLLTLRNHVSQCILSRKHSQVMKYSNIWILASPTQRTWVWAGSRSWWWTGKPGVLQSMGSQRVRHDWATELNWIFEYKALYKRCRAAWIVYYRYANFQCKFFN